MLNKRGPNGNINSEIEPDKKSNFKNLHINSSYKNFLVNLDTYNYENFKTKADKLSIKK